MERKYMIHNVIVSGKVLLSLVFLSHLSLCTHSVPGKRPWALKHNSRFWPTWVLTQDQNPIHLYRSCYSGPLKCDTWALTRKWALPRDTTVIIICTYFSFSKISRL